MMERSITLSNHRGKFDSNGILPFFFPPFPSRFFPPTSFVLRLASPVRSKTRIVGKLDTIEPRSFRRAEIPPRNCLSRTLMNVINEAVRVTVV